VWLDHVRHFGALASAARKFVLNPELTSPTIETSSPISSTPPFRKVHLEMSSAILRSSSPLIQTIARQPSTAITYPSLSILSRPLIAGPLPNERTIQVFHQRKHISSSAPALAPPRDQSIFGAPPGHGPQGGFFRKESLPANTIIRWASHIFGFYPPNSLTRWQDLSRSRQHGS